VRAENDTTAPSIADAFVEPLIAAARAAAIARDPAALTDELTHLVDWMVQAGEICADLRYAAWLRIMPIFADLDLSIWEERPVQVEGLALALARVDYYRQIDLDGEERIALLDRARRLLSPKSYLGLAQIDLARASLLAVRGVDDDVDEALAVCDDALAAIEQLDDVGSRGDALITRALVLSRLDRAREAAVEAERARVIFHDLASSQRLAYACLLLAAINIDLDRVPSAVPLLREALEIYERTQDSVGAGHVLRTRAITWKARGNVPKALDDCTSAAARYDAARMRTWQGRALIQRAGYLAAVARYSEAQTDLEGALSYLASSPEAGVFTHALLQLADVLRQRSATDEAAARLDQAEAALAHGSRPRARLGLLLRLLRIARELSTPDKPRIRRCAAEALSLARELSDDKNEVAVREFLAFAG
jgi:tetratricopeptide (TPR) repeat protein